MFSYIGISKVVVILFILIPLIILIVSLVNILKSNFKGRSKLVWVFVVLIFPVIGAILYFTFGKDRKI